MGGLSGAGWPSRGQYGMAGSRFRFALRSPCMPIQKVSDVFLRSRVFVASYAVLKLYEYQNVELVDIIKHMSDVRVVWVYRAAPQGFRVFLG
eukprot:961959-Pyramimonas_sp.AAC.1